MDLSRRRLLTATTALGVGAGLTACSSGTGTSDTTTPAATAGSEGQDGTFPVTLEHLYGTTVVESAPQRVAVLGVTDADALLALGVQPLTTTGFSFYPETGLGPWAEGRLDAAPVRLASDTEVPVEQVAAVDPDLVLALVSGIEEPLYRQLSELAPVLVRATGEVPYANDRSAVTLAVARALGREAEGRRLADEADAAFTTAAADNPSFAGRTAVVALPYDGKYGVFTPGDGRGAFLAELGFVLPEAVAALDTGDSFFLEVSRERLDLLDADVLVVLTDEGGAPAVQTDEVLAALPVVQRGGLVLPDLDVRGAMTYNSVLSVPYALDRLVPALRDALAGS